MQTERSKQDLCQEMQINFSLPHNFYSGFGWAKFHFARISRHLLNYLLWSFRSWFRSIRLRRKNDDLQENSLKSVIVGKMSKHTQTKSCFFPSRSPISFTFRIITIEEIKLNCKHKPGQQLNPNQIQWRKNIVKKTDQSNALCVKWSRFSISIRI